MSSHTRVAIAVALMLSAPVVAEDVSKHSETSLVQSALEAGLSGDEAGRKTKLTAARSAAPDDPLPRWQLGYVYLNDAWREIEDAESTFQADKKLQAYLRQRSRGSDTIDGHAKLAAWSKRNGLKEQSNAHWYQVLRRDPRNTRALLALDATWYGHSLLTKSAAKRQAEHDGLLRKRLKEHKTRTKSLRKQVVEDSETELPAVVDELRELRGDLAVVVISEVLLKPTEDETLSAVLQTEAVKLLGKLDSNEAIRILVWHAAMSPHEPVRDSARGELTRHPIHVYVPLLLAGLQMPLEVSVNTNARGGRTATTVAVYREGPVGQGYQNQQTSYQNIGGQQYRQFHFGTLTRTWRDAETKLVNL